jgi:hypothetical protein
MKWATRVIPTPKKYHGSGHDVEGKTAFTKGGEEPWADLETNGIDKKNKPKFTNELQDMFIDRDPEMAENKPREEDPGNPDVDAPNF